MLETQFYQINSVYAFLVRNVVVRISWKQILAGDCAYVNWLQHLFWHKITLLEYYFAILVKLMKRKTPPEKAPIRFGILLNNIANHGLKRYALESQESQLSNA